MSLHGALPVRARIQIRILRLGTDGRRIQQTSAPISAMQRAASGNHWSQQIATPTFANLVSNTLKPVVSGREIILFVISGPSGMCDLR